jgi:hypothetical protein
VRIIFTLFTERWRLHLVPPWRLRRYRAGTVEDRDGDCTTPPSPEHYVAAKDRVLRVANNLSDQDTLETTIHEFTHGAFPWLLESWVTAFARDLAALLAKLGFHRKDCSDGE